jgi:hypothetical protein
MERERTYFRPCHLPLPSHFQFPAGRNVRSLWIRLDVGKLHQDSDVQKKVNLSPDTAPETSLLNSRIYIAFQ